MRTTTRRLRTARGIVTIALIAGAGTIYGLNRYPSAQNNAALPIPTDIATPGAVWTAYPLSWHDGDTLTVERAGRSYKVRLAGVDAPEPAQPSGPQALRFTYDATQAGPLSLKTQTVDLYKRIVADVTTPAGVDVERALVGAGLAWQYNEFPSDDATLPTLEAQAQAANIGLWQQASPETPWAYRQRVRAEAAAARAQQAAN